MKKSSFLKMILITLLTSFLLTGCDNKNQQTKETPDTTSKTETEKEEVNKEEVNAEKAKNPSEVIKLEFSSWRAEDADAWKNILAKFHEDYPNIEITFNPIKATEYDAQLLLNLQSGQAGDLFMSRTFDRGITIAKEGYTLPLDEKNIPAIKDAPKSMLSACQLDDGTVFAVPASVSAVGFIYNQSIFETYNLKEPTTWEEFFETCEILKKNGIRPIAMCYKDSWPNAEHSHQLLPAFINGNPEEYRQNLIDGKVSFLDNAFIQHLDTLIKMKPYCGDDFLGISYTDSQQLFITEQAAIFTGGTYELSYFKSANPDLKMGYFSTPSAVTEGKAAPLCVTVAGGYAVNKNGPHVEQALIFLNWLTSEKGSKVYMEYLNTAPAVLPAGTKSSDPLLQEWFSDGGDNFENTMQYWSSQKLGSGTPAAKTLVCEAIQKAWAGEMDANQAAQYIQDGVSQWYPPQQK